MAYGKFDGNRRGYKVDNNFLEYGRGELPYHGSTGSVWSVDVDGLYIPICVNQIHWISMCVNILNRTVEVFDYAGPWKHSSSSFHESSRLSSRQIRRKISMLSTKKTENHLFKWIDEALIEEIRMVDAKHESVAKGITMFEERVMEKVKCEMVRVEHEMSKKLKEKVDLEIARVAQEMKQKLKIATVAMVVVGAIVGIWTSLTV
ncbi:unnamed protein product [Brassica rapa]|uniref:Ubiquitin-like protease family profile domain-containing protein n=2 Tax=Brassica campestris TaxID=3711 RepID=A0A8D9G0H7_BRACM|nr:unnamed protein product [Brassica rapa]